MFGWPNGVRRRVQKRFEVRDAKTGQLKPELSRTKQAMKNDCDINLIVKKHGLANLVAQGAVLQKQYADLSMPVDYHTAAGVVARANQLFEMLPAELRLDFGNDPARFLAFASDDRNKAKMVEMGLLPKSALPVVEPPVAAAASAASATPSAPAAAAGGGQAAAGGST